MPLSSLSRGVVGHMFKSFMASCHAGTNTPWGSPRIPEVVCCKLPKKHFSKLFWSIFLFCFLFCFLFSILNTLHVLHLARSFLRLVLLPEAYRSVLEKRRAELMAKTALTWKTCTWITHFVDLCTILSYRSALQLRSCCKQQMTFPQTSGTLYWNGCRWC